METLYTMPKVIDIARDDGGDLNIVDATQIIQIHSSDIRLFLEKCADEAGYDVVITKKEE